MQIRITRRPGGDACASILAELPEWFGIPTANAEYAVEADGQMTWVATRGGEDVGVMILRDHGFEAIENHLLAVRPGLHRKGVGRALLAQARALAVEREKPLLMVKTLGPSEDYEPYARTRAFYVAQGFLPIEESDAIWGPQNPCLLMVMPLR